MLQSDADDLAAVLVTLAVSCVAYLRNFFDEAHFDDSKVFDGADSLNVKILKRGISLRADLLNDWMDNVIAAIVSRQVTAFCFYVKPDPAHNSFIESYFFEIDYTNRSHQDYNSQLYHILKRLIAFAQNLNELPPERYLSLSLVSNDQTFAPPLFQASDSPCLTGIDESFEMENCGTFKTQKHVIVLRVLAGNAKDGCFPMDPLAYTDLEPSQTALELRTAATSRYGDTQDDILGVSFQTQSSSTLEKPSSSLDTTCYSAESK
ncbi:hypothetical protein KL918_001155 [Ogataea parapolymorpha]|uniref:HORMA domain-containing protein n=1 Tax=Ogataea parapolymorpha (strain ATCC 26012 / BCRC 20466 / JCM 22074 / NRRL Y-7560 / DL-1) TaxID=871575 RepID=W1Q9P7_OGAPD|nr:hypothetical protein HPODL_01638 [Ogataea parapolymorpha DL-1]ESW97541.1 hypothetical protein HPODL_01638 [Ogataea parapolymorpha DL-1]KAG7869610.1 hypothetical protein KL918_001155 [Ogataea parapolymorpha]KAG7875337.1 hypothetical protein KL916_000008 [Ogataea parapolymorpha]